MESACDRAYTPPFLPCLRRSVFFLRTILDPLLVTIIFTLQFELARAFVGNFGAYTVLTFFFSLFFFWDVVSSSLILRAITRISDQIRTILIFVSFFFTNFLRESRQTNQPAAAIFPLLLYFLPRLIFTSLLHFQFLFPATFLSAELPFLPRIASALEPMQLSGKRFFIFSLFISPFFARNTPSSPCLLPAPFPPHSLPPSLSLSLSLFLCLSLLTNFSLLPANRAGPRARIYIYTRGYGNSPASPVICK